MGTEGSLYDPMTCTECRGSEFRLLRNGAVACADEDCGHQAREAPATDPLILPSDEFEAVKARLAELENAVSWGTSCTSCAKVLDSAYTETIRAETAEAKLAALRVLCDSIAASVPEGETATVTVSRVLAIIGTEEAADVR